MKTFRPYSPRQSFLLPPSPLVWLPEGHLAYFILDVVSQLDLGKILEPYEREERGFPPHHPQMMLGLLLYGYCVGLPSSRKIERKTHEDVAEAKAQAAAEKDDSDDDEPPSGPAELPKHRIPRDENDEPTPKAQRNFTDAESRIQKAADGFVQGYNCQAAVDAEHQIIVAEALTNQPPDVEHFAPMLERVVANCGVAPTAVSADSGYFSAKNVAAAEALGFDPHIATGRQKRGDPAPARPRGRPPANLTPKQKMARKLLTRAGKAIYSRRKVIVEPAFGQIKQARGLRQFLMRGIGKVRAEWSLICLTHNLLKLHGATG
jgi:hypothetical protein